MYDKLFIYFCEAIGKFLRSLDTGTTDFELYNLDAKELPQRLYQDWYDRIEVGISIREHAGFLGLIQSQMANISDAGYIGNGGVLTVLTPLLRSPQQNPHAILITLYLNAVMEVIKMGDQEEDVLDVGLAAPYSIPAELSTVSTSFEQ